jgi:hypothetical protein
MSHWRPVVTILTVALAGCTSGERAASADSAKRASTAGGGASRAEGFRFRYSMTTSAPDRAGAQSSAGTMDVSVQVLGGDVRMDFLGDANPIMKKGWYMLMTSASPKLTIVNPVAKTATVMDPAGTESAMAGMKMDVTNATSKVEELGPGETILGFTTRKFRVTNGYTVNMTVAGQTMSSQTQSVSTMDVSEQLGATAPAFQNFGERFANAFVGLGGNGMKQLMELNGKLPKGLALSQEQVVTATVMGRSTTTTSRMRVTSFERGGVEPAVFVLPAGLTTRTMMQLAADPPSARTAVPTRAP